MWADKSRRSAHNNLELKRALTHQMRFGDPSLLLSTVTAAVRSVNEATERSRPISIGIPVAPIDVSRIDGWTAARRVSCRRVFTAASWCRDSQGTRSLGSGSRSQKKPASWPSGKNESLERLLPPPPPPPPPPVETATLLARVPVNVLYTCSSSEEQSLSRTSIAFDRSTFFLPSSSSLHFQPLPLPLPLSLSLFLSRSTETNVRARTPRAVAISPVNNKRFPSFVPGKPGHGIFKPRFLIRKYVTRLYYILARFQQFRQNGEGGGGGEGFEVRRYLDCLGRYQPRTISDQRFISMRNIALKERGLCSPPSILHSGHFGEP